MGNVATRGADGGGLVGGVSNVNYARQDENGDLYDDADDEVLHGRSERQLGLTGQLPGELLGDRAPVRSSSSEGGDNGETAATFSVAGVDPAAFFARGRDYEPVNVNHR